MSDNIFKLSIEPSVVILFRPSKSNFRRKKELYSEFDDGGLPPVQPLGRQMQLPEGGHGYLLRLAVFSVHQEPWEGFPMSLIST